MRPASSPRRRPEGHIAGSALTPRRFPRPWSVALITGGCRQHARSGIDHAEWLGLLLDREIADRQDRQLRARLRYARLRHSAAVEDVDYRTARGLNRALFQKLAMGGWIRESQNLIIVGPSGVGKPWLACALGHRACRDNLSVLYQRIPRLFSDLALARGDGLYARLMRALGGVKLHSRRLGTRNAHGRATPRPAGNRRGPLRTWRHVDHQPDPSGPLARPDRRSNSDRRHPRPRHPQRPSRPGCAVIRSAKRRLRRSPLLDQVALRMERSAQPTGGATPADVDRNGRPTSIGMGGRHQAGITGRLRRNAQWEEYRAAHADGYAYSRYVAAELMLRARSDSRRYWTSSFS